MSESYARITEVTIDVGDDGTLDIECSIKHWDEAEFGFYREVLIGE